MGFERFKNIVQYNIEHQSEMKEKVKDFRETVGITQERNLPNLLLFARPMLDKENYTVCRDAYDTESGVSVCYDTFFDIHKEEVLAFLQGEKEKLKLLPE